MNCVPVRPISIDIINIAFTVIGLFGFLTVFYVYYASKLETRIVTDHISDLVKKSLDNSLNQLTHQESTAVKQALNALPLDNLIKAAQSSDSTVSVHNSWLFDTSLILVGLLVAVLALIIALQMYSCNKCIPLVKILLFNAIIFGLIGLVEYLFFVKIAAHYVPTMPSFIVQNLVADIKQIQ